MKFYLKNGNKYCTQFGTDPFTYLGYNDKNKIDNFPNENFLFPSNVAIFGTNMFSNIDSVTEEYIVPSHVTRFNLTFATNLNINDLGNFKISNGTDFNGLCYGCKNLIIGPTITLPSSNIGFVFNGMFDNCHSLSSVNISFNSEITNPIKFTDLTNFCQNCYALKAFPVFLNSTLYRFAGSNTSFTNRIYKLFKYDYTRIAFYIF